jgi:CIC family chloride channel protein
MAEHEVERASTTDGLPVSMSLGPTLEAEAVPAQPSLVDGRVVFLCVVSIGLALAAALVARGLTHLIGFITNLSFYGRLSMEIVPPGKERLGIFVILVPIVGGVIVGLMARYGSKAIRGHGIPEAMEQVLLNQSRIRARMTSLKPISAAAAGGAGGARRGRRTPSGGAPARGLGGGIELIDRGSPGR